MELSDYFRILRRRSWLIILLAVLTAGAAYAFSKMQEPIYKATAELVITSRPDFGQTQATKELIRDYSAWLKSSYRAGDVINTLDLDMEPLTLLSNTTVAPRTDSNIIQINIKDSNGQVANDIARTWAERLVQELNRRNSGLRKEDWIEAQLLDDPRYGLDSPNTRINTVAGGVFGGLLGILLMLLLEWLDSARVRRPEDIERYLNVPVIGKIPK